MSKFEKWWTSEEIRDIFPDKHEATAMAAWNAALEEAAADCRSRITSGPTRDPMIAGANIALRISSDSILALKERSQSENDRYLGSHLDPRFPQTPESHP